MQQFKDSLGKIISQAKSEMNKQSGLTIINEHLSVPTKSKHKSSQQDTKSKPNQNSKSTPRKSVAIQSRTDLIPPQNLIFYRYLCSQKSSKPIKSQECFQEFACWIYGKNKGGILDLSDCNINMIDYEPLNRKVSLHNRINLESISVELVKLPSLFHRSICELVLRNCGLDTVQLNYLFDCLKGTSIVKLDLSSHLVTNKNTLNNTDKLCQFICSNKTLLILELANLGIHSNQIFLDIKQSSIISLNLGKNEGVLGVTKDLEILRLRGNQIKSLKGLNFKDCVFQELDLSDNLLQAIHMESLLKPQMINIGTLILDQNPLGSLHKLQKFLSQRVQLKSLSLRKCDLSEESIQSLISGVEANSNIETLDISHNKINSDTCTIMAEVLKTSKLKSLYLIQCEILDQDGQKLAKSIANNKRLARLNLSQNRLSHLTGQAMTLALRHNRYIQSLNLSQNIIPYKYTRQIQEWVDYNRHLAKKDPDSFRTVNTITITQSDDSDDQAMNQQSRQLSELQLDISRLSRINSKISSNKQTYDQLQSVFNVIDQEGSDKINKLMDDLDAIQGQIDEQKQSRNAVSKASGDKPNSQI